MTGVCDSRLLSRFTHPLPTYSASEPAVWDTVECGNQGICNRIFSTRHVSVCASQDLNMPPCVNMCHVERHAVYEIPVLLTSRLSTDADTISATEKDATALTFWLSTLPQHTHAPCVSREQSTDSLLTMRRRHVMHTGCACVCGFQNRPGRACRRPAASCTRHPHH